jgi:hypothetical protein
LGIVPKHLFLGVLSLTLGDGHLVGQDRPPRPELNRLGLGLFGERDDPIGRLLRSGRSAGIAVGLFGRPVPRGSWAASAGQPQVLSCAAATTCRVSFAAWKARRRSAKVGRNETFPANFQHLYTRLT